MAKKILVIEDDKILAETLQKILADTGLYQIAVANDGTLGQKLAEEFGPDLIILDLLMAGTSGMDLLAKWHESGLTKRTPIIVATNIDHIQLMNHALDLGVRNYFLKSEMSPESIIDHCAKVLAEAKNPQMPPPAVA
ncbi:MAG TPA: response regulator [Candidatus Saccharimonadia bacterium]|nr:response regulator [Candidatus Saccharimonadia bacterium]